MSERRPIWILTPDHIIDGFDLEYDSKTNQVRLVKDNPGDKGGIVFDITNAKEKDLDFQILVPYTRIRS